jgi:prepilin-type N-terminal cleavage/methylation domain-containing protein
MIRMPKREEGFTLVEMMVGMLILSTVATASYQVLFAQTRATETVESVATVSGEVRLGLNRMVRDTREAAQIASASPSSFTIKVNLDGNGVYDNPNARGDYEVLTYAFDPGRGAITVNGEVLVTGVSPIPGREPFSFTSNWLEYDWNNDGTTTWQEIDAASGVHGVTGVGNNDGVLNAAEFPYLSAVTFALRVSDGGNSADFTGAAQLRNLV